MDREQWGAIDAVLTSTRPSAVRFTVYCSAALHAALDELFTPYRFDVTHRESLGHQTLREYIEHLGMTSLCASI